MNGGKSMRKKRHNYSPEEKVIILKRHLVGRETVSDLCDEYQLHVLSIHRIMTSIFNKTRYIYPIAIQQTCHHSISKKKLTRQLKTRYCFFSAGNQRDTLTGEKKMHADLRGAHI